MNDVVLTKVCNELYRQDKELQHRIKKIEEYLILHAEAQLSH